MAYYSQIVQILYNSGPKGLLKLYPDFDPHRKDPDSYFSYLDIACRQGDLDIVKGFVACGATFSRVTRSGITPLHFACEGSGPWRVKLVDYILSRKDGQPLLNSQTTWGKTPLHVAIIHRNMHIIRKLLKKGANPMLYFKYERRWREDCKELISIFRERYLEMKEWRPWNHEEFGPGYRQAMRTLCVLSKME